MTDEVIDEHRHLEKLLEALWRALEGDRLGSNSWSAFQELSEELRIHFEREDQLYFPAIWGLHPDLKVTLGEVSERHSWFCEQLQLIGDHLGQEDPQGVIAVLRGLDEAFRAHEQTEEQILARVEGAIED